MPLVTATLALQPSPEVTARTVRALTELTVEVLRKELERTTVMVRYVPPEQWARGSVTGSRRFVVEAKITTGTNSADEKAAYIREVQSAFECILGKGTAGYVIVDEITADSWGHAGETQAARAL
jgi:4-oxalocrotonate tautomerase